MANLVRIRDSNLKRAPTRWRSYLFPGIQNRLRVHRRDFIRAALIIVMMVILGIVAILQYRWTAQVTTTAELRISSEVEAVMMDWHFGLFREFAHVCDVLEVGPEPSAHDNWSDYMVRFRRWKQESRNPELIAGVYIWQTGKEGSSSLVSLPSSTNQPEVLIPPDAMRKLLSRLSEHSANVPDALQAWISTGSSLPQEATSSEGAPSSHSLRGWQFDQEIPALVHPIMHHPSVFESSNSNPLQQQPVQKHPRETKRVDWIILTIDRDALTTKTFPALTREYLTSANGPSYSIAVTGDSSHSGVLYSSTPGTTEAVLKNPDASMVIFGPPAESTEVQLWGTLRNAIQFEKLNRYDFSSPAWFPVIRYDVNQQPWKLMIRGRYASLDAAVKGARLRSLTSSAVVLLLLGISMGFIVVTSHRSQKLAEAQLEFVASISHELRTPLAVIGSAADNIADGFVEGKQQLERYGVVLREQTRELTDMVERILLFVAARNNRDHYEMRMLHVSDFLEKAIRDTAYLLQRGGFTLDYECDNDLPPITGDLSALSRCVQNLIVNAVKYSGDSRRIQLQGRLHEVNIRQEIEISVRDRGIGISSADLPHIFEPFFRSPQVSKAHIPGTGLGLPLAKRFAEAMGGTLKVYSKLGEGSKFTLTLPVPIRMVDVEVEGRNNPAQVS